MKPSDLTRTREKLGYSKAELASILHVTYLTVHRWEMKERRIPGMVEAFLERLLKENSSIVTGEISNPSDGKCRYT